MTYRIRRRLAARVTPMLIAACAVLVAAAASFGQTGSTTPNDAEKKVDVAQPQSPPARPSHVGPPAPPSKHAGHTHEVKPGAEVPQPTVVLKPGEVPAIKFDMPTYDFGRVRSGPDVEHEFWFTNTGNGPLEILSVKPS